ncbi:MAG: FtsQ-type POTRA domain-containing protein [Puniceicoccales bacterium]|jgi:cell division septal protein FtsQ|nr:FtsQ-type POTRA domain-containing protein [Puniceicoccales bacterium]
MTAKGRKSNSRTSKPLRSSKKLKKVSKSRTGVKKTPKKGSIGILFFSLLAVSFLWFFVGSNISPGSKKYLGIPHQVQRIEFFTNGTLDRNWVLRILHLQKQTDLDSIDVKYCRNALLRASQICEVEVERIYPSTLRIQLRERIPILKVRRENNQGYYFVDGSGYVFERVGPGKDEFESILLLDGTVDLRRVICGDHIPYVKDLERFLTLARKRIPLIAQKWSSIRIDEDAYNLMNRLPFIEVHGDDVCSILFRNDAYLQQFEKLEYILAEASRRHQLPLQKIDLTVPGRAYVKLPSTH